MLAAAKAVASAREGGAVDEGTAESEGRPLDRGIGGTGVVGTIRRFGSIVVNGIRIAYPKNVRTTIDDVEATPAALKIGHVVRVVAQRRRGVLSTRHIVVESEVVGPVEAVHPEGLIVMGQTVVGDVATWRPGDVVAVSGLRQLDGTIVASLIEARPAAGPRVVGPVVSDADGSARIGALHLAGIDRAFAHRRCAVEGTLVDGVLAVTRVRDQQADLVADRLRRLSVEAYVAAKGAALDLGSGLKIAEMTSPAPTTETRAFLAIEIARDGNFSVLAVAPDGNRGGNSSGRTEPSRPHGLDHTETAPAKPSSGGAPDTPSGRDGIGAGPAKAVGAPGRGPGRGGK